MTAILLELICSIVRLAIKPLSLFKPSCVFAVRSIFIVIQTWIELLRGSIYLHIIIFWKLAIWTIDIVTLPMRAIAALHRERQVQDLKGENQRLKEVEVRAHWSYRDKGDTGHGHDTKDTDKFGESGYNGNTNRMMEHEDIWEEETHEFVKEGSKSKSYGPHIISQDLNTSDILARRRELALSQSLFSAILSLVVGMIVWEAEDPCVPLVAALFTVVAMSLMNVVQFFATIDNKPASDAVALLSFNWFILGTLAYPTLPMVARVLAPLASSVVKQMLVWLSLL